VDIAFDRHAWPLADARRHRFTRVVALWLLLLALAPGVSPFATPHGTLAYAVAAVDALSRVKDGFDLPMLTARPSVVVLLEPESDRVPPRAVVYGWLAAWPDAHAVLRL
jgi:hypothetical protein